jgi:hypothetical protein
VEPIAQAEAPKLQVEPTVSPVLPPLQNLTTETQEVPQEGDVATVPAMPTFVQASATLPPLPVETTTIGTSPVLPPLNEPPITEVAANDVSNTSNSINTATSMNMTEFWYKLIDMAKSDTKIVSLGGLSLTEKQLLWLIGLIALVVLVLLLRSSILWIFRPTKASVPVTEKKSVESADTATVSANKEAILIENTEQKPAPLQETPNITYRYLRKNTRCKTM